MSDEIEETIKPEPDFDKQKIQNDESRPENEIDESEPKNEAKNGDLEFEPENDDLELKPENETLESEPQNETLESDFKNDTLETKSKNETLEMKPKNEALESKSQNDALEIKPKNVTLELKPALNSPQKSTISKSGDKILATVATQTEISVSNFVQVSSPLVEGKSKEIVELPLDKSGELSLDTLRTEFPNASGIKYKNPETGMMRILKIERGRIAPPPEGWGKTQFVVCVAKEPNFQKRLAPSDNDNRPQSKKSKASRGLLQAPALNASMGAMGSMGGPPMSMSMVGGGGGPMLNPGPMMGPPQSPARSLMNPILGLTTSMNGPQGGGPMGMGMGPGPGMSMGNVYTNMSMFPSGPGPQHQGQQFNNGYEISYTDVSMDDIGMQNFDNNNFGPGPIGGPGGPGGGPGLGHPATCDLCHVQLNSATQAQLHFDGKRHADAVIQMQAQMNSGPGGFPMPMHHGGPGPGQSMRTGGGGRTGLLGRGGPRPFHHQPNKGGGGNFRQNNNNTKNFDNRNRRGGNFGGGGGGRGGNRRGGFKAGRGGGGNKRSRDPPGGSGQSESFANDDWSTSGFNDFSGPSA